MKRIIKLTGLGLAAFLVLVAVVIGLRYVWAAGMVAQAKSRPAPPQIGGYGSTTSLSILPLYEAAAAPGYTAGHGVSYLVETDAVTFLMDVGANPDGLAVAPVHTNMERAGVEPGDLNLVVISHNHFDHIGGLSGLPERTASGAPALPPGPLYAPVNVTIADRVATRLEGPELLAPGIVTLGRMPFLQAFPFWLWEPLGYEQALAVNVAGQGLVLITGCGHPGLEDLVSRAESLLGRPVVGVVGGLHYAGLTPQELAPHITFLAQRDPQLVALSPHDSDVPVLEAFRAAFPTAYRDLRVGEVIQFGAPELAGAD